MGVVVVERSRGMRKEVYCVRVDAPLINLSTQFALNAVCVVSGGHVGIIKSECAMSSLANSSLT